MNNFVAFLSSTEYLSSAQNVKVEPVHSHEFFQELKRAHKIMVQFDQQKKKHQNYHDFPITLVTKNPRKGNKGENAKKKFTDR